MYKLGKYKVRKIGGSTVITLPPLWLENHGIRLGQDLQFYEDGNGSLVVMVSK